MPRAAGAAARSAAPARAPRRPARVRPATQRARVARQGAVAAPRKAIRVVPRNGARPAAIGAGVLDRLVRGRAWIACIGALLAGVVFLNVSLLEMNRGITHDAERAAALKRDNAQLRLRVAELASSERIQEAAAARGFVLPAPGEVHYLKPRDGDGERAAERIVAPSETPAPAPQPQVAAPETAVPAPETPAQAPAPPAPEAAPQATQPQPAQPQPTAPAPDVQAQQPAPSAPAGGAQAPPAEAP